MMIAGFARGQEEPDPATSSGDSEPITVTRQLHVTKSATREDILDLVAALGGRDVAVQINGSGQLLVTGSQKDVDFVEDFLKRTTSSPKPWIKRETPVEDDTAGNAAGSDTGQLTEVLSTANRRMETLAILLKGNVLPGHATHDEASVRKRLDAAMMDVWQAEQALLRAEVKELRQRLSRLEQRIADRERRMNEILGRRKKSILSTPAANPNAKVRGLIRAVDGASLTALISVGADDGVKVGDEMTIFRQEKEEKMYVGRLRVMKVQPDSSAAQVMDYKQKIKLGDQVELLRRRSPRQSRQDPQRTLLELNLEHAELKLKRAEENVAHRAEVGSHLGGAAGISHAAEKVRDAELDVRQARKALGEYFNSIGKQPRRD